MATIRQQLTLKEATGSRISISLPTTPLATYTVEEITTLLAGTSPVPEGVRFHFEKVSGNTTVGLIAVSLGVHSVPSLAGGTELHNFEMPSDTNTKKYMRRGRATEDLSSEKYHTDFRNLNVKTETSNNTCVFFSRTDLHDIVSQDGVLRIGLFLGTVDRTFTQNVVETYDTLVAVGLNATGLAIGVMIRSETPCPPHCGDDYP